MARADIIYLVSQSPSAHGVFENPTETKHKVFVEIRSVGYNEFYVAKNAGIEPSIIFVLADYMEYDGQKVVEWNDKRYRVVRTYCAGQKLELTCEVATNDY